MTAPIRRGYFDVEFGAGQAGQIHYREARPAQGAARPLLLLHQSPLSSTQFDAVMPRLVAAGFHALALDMPGFGMSDAAPEPAQFEHFTAILPAALQHLETASAAIVGHHTGAVVAALFAAAAPERVTRLVLNGFPILTQTERDHFASFYFGPKTPEADGSHLLTAWNNRLRSTPGWTDLALMHRYTVEGLYRGATNWRAFPLVLGADLEAVLHRLTVPTLMLTNTGEDLYQSTQRARDLRPDFFAYSELQGGTHDVIDELPGPWTAAVIEFLNCQTQALRNQLAR